MKTRFSYGFLMYGLGFIVAGVMFVRSPNPDGWNTIITGSLFVSAALIYNIVSVYLTYRKRNW